MTLPATAAGRLDPVRLAIRLGVYIVVAWLALQLFGTILVWLGGYFPGGLSANLVVAFCANLLTLRFFTHRRMVELGLWWNRASVDNLAFGFLGGVGAACLVLGPALIAGSARIVGTPAESPSLGAMIFVTVLMAAGSAGEELLMRGYGFQILLATCGTWATVIPVGVVFAVMHTGNPNATWLGIANTAGFGILFGYAYVRSRDLWLPIGLHFGWNFTLPLFGANVSGLRMKITGHDMVWSAGSLWSGGEYGPEASVLTSVVLILLAAYLWRAPIRRQTSPLTDPPGESEACEPSPVLRS